VIWVALIAVLLAAPAVADPWDRGGAIPPSRTGDPALPDADCTQSYANDARKNGPRLRFGIGPRLAGEAGGAQSTPTVPEDARKRDAALVRLRGDRFFAVRLNRLFMSDGEQGIAQFKALADRFAALGLEVELQVRYHPADADDGNIAKWLAFVRRVVDVFGPNERVTGLQITNEVNIAFSKNTSDGFYKDAVRALVEGVVAAKAESTRRGFDDHQQIGFNFAWGLGEQAPFWDKLDDPRLRAATDWVGLDIYPGTYVPALPEIVSIGDAFLEGVAQVRECLMPKAGFGRDVPLRIEETGFPTGPGRPEELQARRVAELVKAANNYRGTYGITDFRFFGLRDNNSAGPDFQSFFGLLRDDYSEKPAFEVYRSLVARYGAIGPSTGSRP